MPGQGGAGWWPSSMNKATLWLVIFTALFVGKVSGENTGLQIEIRPQRNEVKNTEVVLVDTKISNRGKEDVPIHVWICSYDQNWSSDNVFAVIEGISCGKNFIKTVNLKPGESYESPLSVMVSVLAEELLMEEVTFRLGFRSVTYEAPQGTGEAVWSNPITIKVKER